jgi:predicted enzyme related to lactoylglutathione lyase
MASHGHFHWNELMTKDAERAKRFYGGTIGWTFDAPGVGRIAILTEPGGAGVGWIQPTQ